MGMAGPDRFTAKIAEFVGALHLGKVIESGLPAKRIISLMVGTDNLVVTGLRGLSAWLAVNCKIARPVLIDSDPTGVGLYGDIHDFSVEDKYALLDSLRGEVSRLNSLIDAAPAFAGLASHEMAPAIEMVLSEDDRNYDTESFRRVHIDSSGTRPTSAGTLRDPYRYCSR